jgi:hypothetical protein
MDLEECKRGLLYSHSPREKEETQNTLIETASNMVEVRIVYLRNKSLEYYRYAII